MIEEDPPAGVPEWIVTYGDMMSLLLTFFIMLVSLSEVKADGKYRAVLDAIQQRLGYNGAPFGPSGEGFPLNAIVEQLRTLGGHTNEDSGKGGVRAAGTQGSEFRVFRRRDGVAVKVGGELTFEPEQSALSPSLSLALDSVAQVLSGKPHKIEVRGHAPAAEPLPDGTVPERFTLAYTRARNVVRFLEQHGIQHTRLRISAAAEARPRKPGDQEREWFPDRVEILVLDTLSEEYSGERDIPQ